MRYVLEGSVRKVGDRVRINAQLVEATTGGHLWTERYDRDLTDIFALQDEITQKIVAALAMKLTGGGARLAMVRPPLITWRPMTMPCAGWSIFSDSGGPQGCGRTPSQAWCQGIEGSPSAQSSSLDH